ncbi:MAG: gamma-glutamylcyclotransferase [Planctomycetota bacterium]|nr:MAG: gamma-glutamylcyclotransferase [Planctomycetota bacterium]
MIPREPIDSRHPSFLQPLRKEFPMALWYLAYGSNMDCHRLSERLERHCDIRDAVPVHLPNWYCCFDKASGSGHGYATLKPQPAGDGRPDAEGLLWEVSADELALLDSYEGVHGGHYQRHNWTVRDDQGQPYESMVYLHGPDFDEPGLLPTPAYLQHLLCGAPMLSPAYAAWLRQHPTWRAHS